MEPATVTSGIIATLVEWGSWIITGGFIIAFIKVVVDYAYVKRDVKQQGEDIKEIKDDVKKILACSHENGKKIAVLDERSKKDAS